MKFSINSSDIDSMITVRSMINESANGYINKKWESYDKGDKSMYRWYNKELQAVWLLGAKVSVNLYRTMYKQYGDDAYLKDLEEAKVEVKTRRAKYEKAKAEWLAG